MVPVFQWVPSSLTGTTRTLAGSPMPVVSTVQLLVLLTLPCVTVILAVLTPATLDNVQTNLLSKWLNESSWISSAYSHTVGISVPLAVTASISLVSTMFLYLSTGMTSRSVLPLARFFSARHETLSRTSGSTSMLMPLLSPRREVSVTPLRSYSQSPQNTGTQASSEVPTLRIQIFTPSYMPAVVVAVSDAATPKPESASVTKFVTSTIGPNAVLLGTTDWTAGSGVHIDHAREHSGRQGRC